ncbi:methyltransferase domain-containing protein [Jatrophihabitans lederbergiae]|uniref:Methyltransferase domain-containing protein n=1 Tax=Jatrophihabitans lederbergiae TaxID=3075547 RepID=A0ABU2JDQ7_9ACTN|nr:methyltransferase domain-containing protein [Jatrophihabitans sp. DSM 44399]MDT0263116.1 methyltransferase domain-containing protein [Jatrophihabitans sp. DSM 44399]
MGELSRATGLSVRVLRHWEQLGLVTPARTASGHRRYGAAEVTRLYRALALRRTGLSLRQVATLLEEQDPDPSSTLRAHLAELDEDLRRRGGLRDRLASALAGLEGTDPANHGESGTDAQLLMKVIETMMMFEQYVHGYRPEENLRLHDQAGTLVELLHGDTGYPPGSTVLEVGCGVGAQTVTLAGRSPGARITSVDISTDSLAEAKKRIAAAGIDTVTFASADVFALPHHDGALAAEMFDHVFVCFLLEHLPRPVEALTRLRSMLKPGGSLTVIEGDHGSTYFHPDSDAAQDTIDCQITLQRHAKGDALIGRRLYPLLAEAGCHDVTVSPRMVYVDATRPDLVDGFIRKTFTAMIAGVREPAIAAGLIDADRFDTGIRDLERTTEPDGVFCYTFFKATATR